MFSKILPKKKNPCKWRGYFWDGYYTKGELKSFNRAVDECEKALVEKFSVDEIDSIIKGFLNKWAEEDGFTNGIGTLRREELSRVIYSLLEER